MGQSDYIKYSSSSKDTIKSEKSSHRVAEDSLSTAVSRRAQTRSNKKSYKSNLKRGRERERNENTHSLKGLFVIIHCSQKVETTQIPKNCLV